MSEKAPGLYGTETYAFESHTNAPTKSQTYLIKEIEKYLGKKFTGYNSRQAYTFIGNNHKAMMAAKAKKKRPTVRLNPDLNLPKAPPEEGGY
jgi:hypothetical protein